MISSFQKSIFCIERRLGVCSPKVAELKGANVEKLKELVEAHRKPLNIQGEDF